MYHPRDTALTYSYVCCSFMYSSVSFRPRHGMYMLSHTFLHASEKYLVSSFLSSVAPSVAYLSSASQSCNWSFSSNHASHSSSLS